MGAIVETRSGKLEGVEEEGIQAFRGIPFARPPVGPLRFAAPVREVPWKGVRDAAAFGASAPQNAMALPLPGMDVGRMDEDCLTLNVYTPAADGGRRPVMVWIHGGGFVIGSGSQALYDGVPLARRGDVVVVTVNYRLGPLGFLHLGDVCSDPGDSVGNAGIRDQVAALEWVKECIGAFGGNPDDVTIFGESAGGMSVGTLLGAPSARGLFGRAIPQSGAAHNVHSRDSAAEVASHFLEHLGISGPDAIARLRELPPDKLLDTQQQTVLKLGSSAGLLPFQPCIDDDFLPVPPLEAVRGGAAAGVDLMTGTNRDEWKLFGVMDPSIAKLDEPALVQRLAPQVGGKERAGEIVARYRSTRKSATVSDLFFAIETDRVFRVPALRLADAQGAHSERVYMYRFDWESPAMGGALGACHAVELPFVFGVLHKEGADFFAGTGPEADRLSERAMDAWLAFARSGSPAHADLDGGHWPGYDREKRATMVLGRDSGCELDPCPGEREIWDGLL